jgi:serine/threonine-protein kinase
VDTLQTTLAAALTDRYTIERTLGRGGMATVFLARDLKHDRPVALKVLHPELASALGPERFQREIQFAARLQHPHICTVHDSGVVPGEVTKAPIYWFTMPYVEGESLRDRMTREGQLPLEDALGIALEAAEALDYAHRHGVVHRDVKPENILLTGKHALVADFGIARALAGDGPPGRAGVGLTETGMAVGTPAYMSPEQASGERELDARTDVYALGSVLYEMLAGEAPFTGPTVQAVLAKRLATDPTPLGVVRSGLPAGVAPVVSKAMARSPADRYPTAAALATELEAALRVARRSSTAATATTGSGPGAARPFRASAALFLVGLLVGLGVLFAWRRHAGSASAGAPSGEIRLAVLPFENLGDSSDAYFADGMTDEIRAKLASLPGLLVTASRSAAEYRHSSKSTREIANELGVDYLLVGKVRWDKGGGVGSQVRVSPELIQVTSGAGATTRWEDAFDATLTNVFKVQSDIAGRVAQALNLALGQTEQQELTARPTQNLAAYDAYLHARGTGVRTTSLSAAETRRAIEYYQRAVALDSGFVQAWSELSRVHSGLYYVSASREDSAAAASAAERALTIDPKYPGGYLAKGEYYNFVVSDWPAALGQFAKGRKLAPRDADLLAGTAFAQFSSGRWEEALTSLQEAQRLDPRSTLTAQRLTRTLTWLRRYPEAEQAADRSLALTPLDPGAIEDRAIVPLAAGDLNAARAVVRTASKGVDPIALVSYIAVYWDLYWLLDDDQQALLLRIPRTQFDNDIGWALACAQTYDLRGDPRRAKASADTAVMVGEQAVRAAPNDAQSKALLGLAYAYAGRRSDAIRLGEQAVAMTPFSQDAYSAPYYMHLLARVYVRAGQPEKALDLLEQLIRVPYYLSPGWLRIDPEWKPLQGNPRFERLVK